MDRSFGVFERLWNILDHPGFVGEFSQFVQNRMPEDPAPPSQRLFFW